ncbi:MAG: hypothetical protein M1812_004130 [Candelaria pacifica]|nr:MAG: hypothetical protein M1812_004130 [Candelaria pacifica]
MSPLIKRDRLTALPGELLIEIVAPLSRNTLKSLRLACSLLNSVATPPLFKRVYFAARIQTLEAFTAVSGDPLLSQCVHEIVYDSSYYEPALVDAVAHSHEFVSAVWAYNLDFERSLLPELEKRSIDSYRDRFNEQEDIRLSGEDLARLTAGLIHMRNVKTIVIQDYVSGNEQDDSHYNSQSRPIVGQGPAVSPEWWHAYIDDPPMNHDREDDHDLESPNPRPYNCFNVVLRALSLSETHIKELRVNTLEAGAGLPHSIFRDMSALGLRHTSNAFRSLRMLSLGLFMENNIRGDRPEEAFKTIESGIIGKIISMAENLQHLKLAVHNVHLDHHHAVEKYLGKRTWPSLRSLCLGSMQILAGSLVPFLRRHAKTLRYLALVNISIDDENFADSLDQMRKTLRLETATIRNVYWSVHDEYFESSDHAEDTEYDYYLVHGGPNPLHKRPAIEHISE